MADKKWFTSEDEEVAKLALKELLDLTEKRQTKSDVLDKLKDQIILLSGQKGYSVEDIRSALETVGIQTSVKAIREILNVHKKFQGVLDANPQRMSPLPHLLKQSNQKELPSWARLEE